MNHDVFVSYSSKDKVVADAVVAALELKGVRCWYAPRDIGPGMDWGRSISGAINQCAVVLLIFSGNANRSQRVLDEIYYAISEEKAILPFRIENLAPTEAMRLHLASRHWLDAYQPSWHAHIDSLVTSLAAFLTRSIVSKNAEEQVQKSSVSPAIPPGKLTRKKRLRWLWIGALVIPVTVLLTWSVIPGSPLQSVFFSAFRGLIETQEVTAAPATSKTPTNSPRPTTAVIVTPTPDSLNHYNEFALPILEQLANIGPDYMDDFSSQSPEWEKQPPGIDILNDVLQVEGKQKELDFQGIWQVDPFPINYVLQFEFEADEILQTMPFEINYRSGDDGSYNIAHLNLGGSYFWTARLITNNKQRSDNIGLRRANLLISETCLVTFIVQRTESILILEQENTPISSAAVFYLDNDAIDRGGLSIKFNNDETLLLKIDNLKIWDLDADYLGEFVDPIMKSIATTTPDYEDDFIALNPAWQVSSDMYIADGDLVMEKTGDTLSGPLIQSRDFALELTLKILHDPYDPLTIYLFQMRGDQLGSGGYNFDVIFQPDDNHLLWQISTEGDAIGYKGNTAAFHDNEYNRILFLAQDKRFAVLLNDELLYYFEDETYVGDTNKLLLSTLGQEVTLYLSQLRFWRFDTGIP